MNIHNFSLKEIYYKLPVKKRKFYRIFINFLKLNGVLIEFLKQFDINFCKKRLSNSFNSPYDFFLHISPEGYLWWAWNWRDNKWSDLNDAWQRYVNNGGDC